MRAATERERESPAAHCATAEEEDGGRAGRASMLGRTRIHLLRDERRSVRDPACPCVRASVCARVRVRAPAAPPPLKLTSCRRQSAEGDADMFGGAVAPIPQHPRTPPPMPPPSLLPHPHPHPATSPLSASPSDASATRISARVKRVTAARLVGVAPARLGEEQLSAAPRDGSSPPDQHFGFLGLFPSD